MIFEERHRGVSRSMSVAILSTQCVLMVSPVSCLGSNSSYWHSSLFPLLKLPYLHSSAMDLYPVQLSFQRHGANQRSDLAA